MVQMAANLYHLDDAVHGFSGRDGLGGPPVSRYLARKVNREMAIERGLDLAPPAPQKCGHNEPQALRPCTAGKEHVLGPPCARLCRKHLHFRSGSVTLGNSYDVCL